MDGWIKYDGGNCPVPPDTWVQITSTRGVAHDDVLPADKWEWQYIAAYRVFAPVAPDQPATGPSDFVRETAARIMAADYWTVIRTDDEMAKTAVAAALALEKALQEAGK